MSTVIRAEISRKNPYFISRHRYFELKHFCLQYPEWKNQYLYLKNHDGIFSPNLKEPIHSGSISDHTSRIALERAYYKNCIEMIESVAMDADYEIGQYILKAVTEGRSFNYLKTKLEIPCGKDMYYNRYRKFFYLLSKSRN